MTQSCLSKVLIFGQPFDPCTYSSAVDRLVMAVTASSTSSGPRFRYAPEDPTVPKPWKVLVDGSTGYLYFWNTETNVTQYERPVATSLLDPVATSLLDPISTPQLKSASSPINTSAQIEQPAGSSLQGHQKHEGGDDDAPRQAAVPAAQKHPVSSLLIVNYFSKYNMPFFSEM